MINKLYRKIYLYTFVILIATTFLTTVIVNLITSRDFQKRLNIPFGENLVLLSSVLLETYEKNPEKLEERIIQLGRHTSWDISYWKGNNCVYHCSQEHILAGQNESFSKLLTQKKPQVIHREKTGPILMGYLSKNDFEKGIIMVSLNNFPPPRSREKQLVLTALFIMIFLGIFLIPYTRYLLKPFKDLIISINNVSSGNFSKGINISDKSEFREIAEAFNNMVLKIRNMLNEKQRLIADVSHELRTPLAKIRLAQELLLKEGKGNQKYIDRSIQESENLDNLINDLLDASELELNTEKYRMESLDFREIINENIEKNMILFHDNNIKIIRIFPERPVVIKVEKLLIERVFNNIFSNITKYAPKNSEVELNIELTSAKAFLNVRDYGAGVEAEHLEKIFEPFYRTDQSRTRDTGGTGLGLAIVKKIIELHGGAVKAGIPSDFKGGLLLTIELPLTF